MRNLVFNDLLGALESFNPAQGHIRVDIKETGDKFSLVADIPGIAKEEVKIKFEAGYLTLAVTPQAPVRGEGEKIHRNERFASLKSRSFYFGDNVNDGEIKASVKDGVLYLDIPKHKPTVDVREITVE